MRAVAAMAGLCLLAACASPPAAPGPAPSLSPERAPDFPRDYYRAAAARGEAVYRLDPARSRALVRVYRAGPLARFGHDHLVASRDVHGYVHLASGGSRTDLYLPLATLEVDPPDLRAEAGLDGGLSARDARATRANMLRYVLDAGRFPYLLLHAQPIAREAHRALLAADITLHGQTRRLRLEVGLERPDAGSLEVVGEFALVQSDFGIAPFSALGGALRVADRVDVSFRLYATRIQGVSRAGSRQKH